MDYTRDRRILDEAEATGEPVIVFRAKDMFAATALGAYLRAVAAPCDDDFVLAVSDRLKEFRGWQHNNAGLLKVPDLRPGEPV